VDNTSSAQPPGSNNQTPEAEDLKPRSDDNTAAAAAAAQAASPPDPKKRQPHGYRPSHKATFIGIIVVVAILAVNAVVIGFVLKKQSTGGDLSSKGQVSISSDQLSKLGIDRNKVGNSGVKLIVAPDAQFQGKLSVAGDAALSGQLILNGKLTVANASISQLQAGNTSLSQLAVNGSTTLSDLNLRQNLLVTGTTQLQGPVTLHQLLTINGSENVTSNLSIGGTLTVGTFSARSLTSTSTLTIGGHVITNGLSPGVGPGSALGSNGTVSISGNDSAGVIAINIGTSAVGGSLASVAFRTQFSSVPRVVITPVGVGANFYVFGLTTSGFSVGVTAGLPPGGYRINYIAEQ
jgi:hypothetical protein